MLKINLDKYLSSKYHKFIINSDGVQFNCLITALSELLPKINKTEWEDRISYGGVYINGRNAKLGRHLTSPCKLEYYEPTRPLSESERAYASYNIKENIIFEDEYLLAVFKPEKLNLLPAKEQQHINLKKSLEKYTKSIIHFPSRLDFSTCGLLICSKNSEMHGELQKLFEHRKIEKNYLAVAKKVPFNSVSVKAGIERDPRHRILRKACLKSKINALTYFYRLKNDKHSSLILAKPVTGRTHQIRVHLASLGFPINGDIFYGGEKSNSLNLMSYSTKFIHPKTKKEMFIKVPKKLFPDWLNLIYFKNY